MKQFLLKLQAKKPAKGVASDIAQKNWLCNS